MQTIVASKTSIAIVEDSPEMLARFVAAIDSQHNQFELMHTAQTGQSMVAWLNSNAPHVLLVDLGLPDMSGLQVISHCRHISPRTDIMVISIFGDEKNMMAAFEAGATGYLLKDGSEDDLVQHIQHLHSGGSPMSPLIARQLINRMRGVNALDLRSQTAPTPTSVTLTYREHDILLHLSQGFSYIEVAQLLNISVSTVCSHVKNIYRKLEVHSKSEAIFEARQLGILPH